MTLPKQSLHLGSLQTFLSSFFKVSASIKHRACHAMPSQFLNPPSLDGRNRFLIRWMACFLTNTSRVKLTANSFFSAKPIVRVPCTNTLRQPQHNGFSTIFSPLQEKRGKGTETCFAAKNRRVNCGSSSTEQLSKHVVWRTQRGNG